MSNYLSLLLFWHPLPLLHNSTTTELCIQDHPPSHQSLIPNCQKLKHTHLSIFLYLTTFPTPKVFANLQKPKQKHCPIKQKMTGRREMHRNTSQSIRKTRIAIAIAIGVTLGCVFAIFFPHGLFTSSAPIITRSISKSNAQVPILQPHFFFFY